MAEEKRKRLPDWLKRGLINTENTREVRRLLSDLNLNTVCDHARCPNKGECYSRQVATFMISGNKCTRNCKFCSVSHETPSSLDINEPANLAMAVSKLKLKYIVITAVTRDDLNDGGASHFAQTVKEIKRLDSDIIVEVLIPDFQGNKEALKAVLDSGISVLNHNVETVKELYKEVRPQADYYRSLEILEFSKNYRPDIITKSGFMVGLGEEIKQIESLLKDLYTYKCDIVTIGQYIQPAKQNLIVKKYYTEEEFVDLEKLAQQTGIRLVLSGPLIRSSYKAFDSYLELTGSN